MQFVYICPSDFMSFTYMNVVILVLRSLVCYGVSNFVKALKYPSQSINQLKKANVSDEICLAGCSSLDPRIAAGLMLKYNSRYSNKLNKLQISEIILKYRLICLKKQKDNGNC